MKDTLYDLSQLHELSAGNPEFVEKMVHMFLALTPELIQRLKNGLNDKNFAEIKSAAHKMKPSIDMMGIVSLSQKIRILEQYAASESHTSEIPSLIGETEEILKDVMSQLKQR